MTSSNMLELSQILKQANLTRAVKTGQPEASGLLFDNLITTKELADYIGVSPKTIQNWVALRSIPFFKDWRENPFLEGNG